MTQPQQQQPQFVVVPDAGASPQVRRGADVTSVVSLLLNLPLFLGSLLVIWLISRMMPSGLDTAFVIAWLASGALVFHRPTERGLARLLFKMRRPTGAELAALQPLWDDVTRRAGVDGSRYELWMEDTDELNASAAAGHLVGVTRGAMRQPPQHLSAVLAHELGHHVGGHSWALLLGHWYAVPVRMLMTVVKFVLRFLFYFTAELSCLAVGVFVLIFGSLAVATFLAFPPAVALYTIPFLLAWSGRQSELRADRFAGRLGYGPLMIELFTGWQAEGHDDAARKASPVARLMSTHPPLHQRIRALETFVS
ncbi:M48 family metalloprotease [Streptomyces sp. NPDC002328]|uniref:M48 family metalloprotease n=1 Tax=Streptomyces sp. NPDC002328 TaxID=3364642 RepID=UPI003692D393